MITYLDWAASQPELQKLMDDLGIEFYHQVALWDWYLKAFNAGHAPFDEGYEAGFADGKGAGYQEGHHGGYELGVADGYDTGYSEGESRGLEQGREEGYSSAATVTGAVA